LDETIESPPTREALIKEAWIAVVAILLLLGVVKHVGRFVPFIGDNAFTIAAAFQLYVPVLLIGKRGVTKESLGLVLSRWKEDLSLVGLISLITIVPFAIAHHFWQTLLFHRLFHARLPEDVLQSIITQFLVVAIAEELYFRGYLQERLTRIWPPTRRIFGVPFGWAIVVSAAVFALGHFVGEYRPDRLGPFFPALVFGLLRQRTQTIVGAAAYHAFCNLLGDVLFASYR
jgi:membrane protease YdiL (CAAX protease family)